jgi:hypothetical protein
MFHEEAAPCDRIVEGLTQLRDRMQLALKPLRHCLRKRLQPFRREANVVLHDARELEAWFLIVGKVIDLGDADTLG